MPTARTDHPLWLARLVFPTRFGKVFTAFLIFLLVWELLDALEGNVGFFAQLFFAAMCAYIVPLFRHILDRSVAGLDAVSSDLEADEEEIAAWRHRLLHQSTLMLVLVNLGAIAAWFAQIWLFAASKDVSFLDLHLKLHEWDRSVGALLVWLAMTNAVSALTRNALVLANIAGRLRIDLLQSRQANTLAEVAVVSTLALVGAQALFVFLVLDANASLVGVLPGFIATALPMVALFLIPTLPLHRRLRARRREELARIDVALSTLRTSPNPPLDDPAGLDRLNGLLAYRREIRQISEWPFDMTALAQLAIYLVLPPLTWVGAALIEQLIDYLL